MEEREEGKGLVTEIRRGPGLRQRLQAVRLPGALGLASACGRGNLVPTRSRPAARASHGPDQYFVGYSTSHNHGGLARGGGSPGGADATERGEGVGVGLGVGEGRGGGGAALVT